MADSAFELRPLENGDFDELVATDVQMVHFEMLSHDHLWCGITLKDGRRVTLSVWAKKRLHVKVDEEVA